jgi:glutaredoxin-related protein
MRQTIEDSNIEPSALTAIENLNPIVVKEIQDAVKKYDWVIVGMALNPVVKKARKHLESKSIEYHYITHGGYFSKWKLRLAIKLWSGWPTFPQVFHKGVLIGGAADLKKYLP